MEELLIKKLEERILNWKTLLLDTSKRNRLLYYKPHRASSLLIGEGLFEDGMDPKHIIEDLVANNTPISFSVEGPSIPDKPEESSPDFELKLKEYEAKKETSDKIKARSRTLENIRRKINAEYNEKGINIGYIAVGFLKWYERDDASLDIKSPLVMVPIIIEQEGRKSPYTITLNPDEEITINAVIQKKFDTDFNLKLAPADCDFNDLNSVLDKIRGIVSSQKSWQVSDDIVLDTFNFQNLVIWNDLDKNSELIKESPFAQILVGEDREKAGIVYSKEEIALKQVKSEDKLCVLETDSSQLEAMCRASCGESFVIQGPPGTGKSQTITNIIAEQLYLGKKVLFVSEKQAALDVVFHKLEQAKLGDFCLIMHNKKQNKSDIRAQLQRSVDLAKDKKQVAKESLQIYELLDQKSQKLNLYTEKLHNPCQNGKTPYRIIGEAAKLIDCKDLVFNMPDGFNWNQEYTELFDAIEEYGLSFVSGTHHFDNNYWQYYTGTFSASTEREAKEILFAVDLDFLKKTTKTISETYNKEDIAGYIKALQKIPFKQADAAHIIAESMAIDTLVDNISELSNAISANDKNKQEETIKANNRISELSDTVDLLRKGIREHFREDFFAITDFEDTYKILINKYNSIFRHFSREYWDICNKLDAIATSRLKYTDYVAHLRTLIDIKAYTEEIALLKDNLEGIVLKINFENAYNNKKITEAQEELRKKIATLSEDMGRSTTYIETLLQQLDFEKLQEYNRYVVAKEALLSKYHLNSFIEKIEDPAKTFQKEEILNIFKKRLYSLYLEQTELGNKYHNYTREQHNSDIDAFREYDRQSLQMARWRVCCQLLSKIPNVSGFNNKTQSGEVGLLRYELSKKTKLMPTRELIRRLPLIIPQLKPCMMMSPLTVSSYFGANRDWKFDVVIFDEASQIKPEYAIPAIARAKQIIVAGDSKQMPPTKFFEVGADEEEEEWDSDSSVARKDLESILDGMASILPDIDLKWHYRSKDERLIAFSNRNFYQDKLFTFPSTSIDNASLGVSFEYCEDGIWESKNGNQIEAEKVARIIFDHIINTPDMTLGVIAFGKSQENAILEAVDKMRDMHPELESFFTEAKAEPFFIKNLENVQGDERDRIILSCGYGKDASGTFAMRFGPLGQVGGERRLNVAVSRAKYQMTVVSSFKATDIRDPDSQPNRKLLRDFIYYAEHRILPNKVDGDNQDDAQYQPEFDSCFEEDVYNFLTGKGYKLRTQHGQSKYKIDIVVLHPEISDIFVLAIECDGATYHSSRTARDRDILRQSILEGLGWKFYRVWSTNWLYDNKNEKEKLLRAIDEAIKNPYPRMSSERNSRKELTPIKLEQIQDKNLDNFYREYKKALQYKYAQRSFEQRCYLGQKWNDLSVMENTNILALVLPEVIKHRTGFSPEDVFKEINEKLFEKSRCTEQARKIYDEAFDRLIKDKVVEVISGSIKPLAPRA